MFLDGPTDHHSRGEDCARGSHDLAGRNPTPIWLRGRNWLNIWVHSVDSAEEARCVTADYNRSVLSYQWTDDPRWLLYIQDDNGDPAASPVFKPQPLPYAGIRMVWLIPSGGIRLAEFGQKPFRDAVVGFGGRLNIDHAVQLSDRHQQVGDIVRRQGLPTFVSVNSSAYAHAS